MLLTYFKQWGAAEVSASPLYWPFGGRLPFFWNLRGNIHVGWLWEKCEWQYNSSGKTYRSVKLYTSLHFIHLGDFIWRSEKSSKMQLTAKSDKIVLRPYSFANCYFVVLVLDANIKTECMEFSSQRFDCSTSTVNQYVLTAAFYNINNWW